MFVALSRFKNILCLVLPKMVTVCVDILCFFDVVDVRDGLED